PRPLAHDCHRKSDSPNQHRTTTAWRPKLDCKLSPPALRRDRRRLRFRRVRADLPSLDAPCRGPGHQRRGTSLPWRPGYALRDDDAVDLLLGEPAADQGEGISIPGAAIALGRIP